MFRQRSPRVASSAVEKAYSEIRARIISGHLPQGARLKEEDLALEIGVSRTPVREAVRRLAQEGMVELRPNSGALVAKWSVDDLVQLFDLRATLEGSVASLAAERMDSATLATLRTLARTMEVTMREGGPHFLERIAELNDSFHKGILAAADSPRLSRMMAQLVELPIVLRTFNCYSEEELRRSLGHHVELVAAFEARDAVWAESVMKAHVLSAKHALVAAQRARESDTPLVATA
ncbi:MAG TPA: GntR family transcriptional regulator [Ferrovibrio sp.]|jgi:DNA-binding GntR family transcriptional regulator|uniref:GntR family transcriptional regulator n=1 Tax=Ferrovibrio sp. TaxID=1917215 RepID=UPI002B4AAE3F|nr:GntR family transcriptional regulator [Ferrovibrio sp.]HLT76341.1 GntR family transcriptional regulator [Ferrovibrio sp.]